MATGDPAPDGLDATLAALRETKQFPDRDEEAPGPVPEWLDRLVDDHGALLAVGAARQVYDADDGRYVSREAFDPAAIATTPGFGTTTAVEATLDLAAAPDFPAVDRVETTDVTAILDATGADAATASAACADPPPGAAEPNLARRVEVFGGVVGTPEVDADIGALIDAAEAGDVAGMVDASGAHTAAGVLDGLSDLDAGPDEIRGRHVLDVALASSRPAGDLAAEFDGADDWELALARPDKLGAAAARDAVDEIEAMDGFDPAAFEGPGPVTRLRLLDVLADEPAFADFEAVTGRHVLQSAAIHDEPLWQSSRRDLFDEAADLGADDWRLAPGRVEGVGPGDALAAVDEIEAMDGFDPAAFEGPGPITRVRVLDRLADAPDFDRFEELRGRHALQSAALYDAPLAATAYRDVTDEAADLGADDWELAVGQVRGLSPEVALDVVEAAATADADAVVPAVRAAVPDHVPGAVLRSTVAAIPEGVGRDADAGADREGVEW